MNVIGAVELPRRRANLGVSPAQVADAPAHHEVDVFATAGVGEIAVSGVADDHVLRFALAAEVLFVELAEIHVGSCRKLEIRAASGDYCLGGEEIKGSFRILSLPDA